MSEKVRPIRGATEEEGAVFNLITTVFRDEIENKSLVRWVVQVNGRKIQQWWGPARTHEEIVQSNTELFGACEGAYRDQ